MPRSISIDPVTFAEQIRNTVLALWILFFLVSVVRADEIVLVADKWCPYNCAPGDELPGFMVDIAEYAFAKQGHTVRYQLLPWARAIATVRDGLFHGIIGTGRSETPDFVFPSIALGQASQTFYTRKGFSWSYEGLDSLNRITLGVINGYSYGKLLEHYIKPNTDSKRIQIVSGKTALKQNIEKLTLGRIDALIEDKNVFQYHLHARAAPNEFSAAGVAYTENVYIAFSPKLEQAQVYAALLDKAMTVLRKQGELQAILDKYGLDDWQ